MLAGKSRIHDINDLRRIDSELLLRYNKAARRLPAIKGALWQEVING